VVLAHFEKEVEFEVHIFYCAGGKLGEVAGAFLAPDAGFWSTGR